MSINHRTFRFHILGLAHLPVTEKYNSCAFTQKIHKLCEMLMSKGHKVFLYASEGSDAKCTELIETHKMKQIRDAFGDKDYKGTEEIGYDWQNQQFRHDFNDYAKPIRQYVIHRMIAEVLIRKQPGDFLLLTMGNYHKDVKDAVGLYLSCESGIGYYGHCAPFCAFESSFILHYQMGRSNKDSPLGSHYHRVIPNYYRLADFPFVEKPAGDSRHAGEPYFLFLGRIIYNKGIETAIYATKKANVRFIIGGQGGTYDKEKHTLTVDNNVFELGEKQEFIGFVGPEQRKTLMGNAVATIAPTYYMEPFCGVNAESQLCGTPVITTDFAAFTDTVEHARTGYRCNSSNDFVQAIKHAHLLDREYICKRAQALWSMEAVNEQYEKWWQDLYDVYESTLLTEEQKKIDQGGFFKIRTEEEEHAAGTVESFFDARKPFDQLSITI